MVINKTNGIILGAVRQKITQLIRNNGRSNYRLRYKGMSSVSFPEVQTKNYNSCCIKYRMSFGFVFHEICITDDVSGLRTNPEVPISVPTLGM